MAKDSTAWCNFALRHPGEPSVGAVPIAGQQASKAIGRAQPRNSLQGVFDERERELITKSERTYAKLTSTAPTVSINLSNDHILKNQFIQNDAQLAKQYKPPVFTKPRDYYYRTPNNKSIQTQILEKAPKVPVFGSSDVHLAAPVQTKMVSGNYTDEGKTPSAAVQLFVDT